MKALAAGKHVLLEKPSADTAQETLQMFELAERKGLVLLEAFHYRQACYMVYICTQQLTLLRDCLAFIRQLHELRLSLIAENWDPSETYQLLWRSPKVSWAQRIFASTMHSAEVR